MTIILYKCSVVKDVTTLVASIFVLCGAFIALFGVKEQNRYKVNVEVLSKNRQEWINDLRKVMTEYMTFSEQVFTENNKNLKFTEDYNIIQKYRYIRLLLSPSQQGEYSDSVKIIEAMNELNQLIFYNEINSKYGKNTLHV